MRLSDEQLMAGFVHPSRVVRGAVADYFAESFTRDPDVTRWAIRGVEQYGWKAFLTWTHKFCDLPLLNDESFEWVCQQLERTDTDALDSKQRQHLARMLANADAGVLTRQQPRLLAMDALDAKSREVVVRRIELAQTDPEVCWQKLEEHCRQIVDVESFEDAQIPEATRLLESLMRDGDRFVSRILEVLRRPQPVADAQHPDEWLIGLMMILAGHLRLEEAAPLIWDRWEADWDWYNEEVMYSLIRIGTPAVVQLARERYPESEWYVRNFAHNIFENVRCEKSLEAIQAVIPGEDDEFLRGQLGIAASTQFDDRVATLARELWDENPDDRERDTIRDFLVTFSHLSGWELPEREQWEKAIQAEDDRILQIMRSESLFDVLPSRLDDGDKDEFFDENFPSNPAGTIIRHEPRIGRNDPCPCGSGKKYKKCCLSAAVRSN